MGSGTGRAMGFCSGVDQPGYAGGPGRGCARQGGLGRGHGRGRGRRRGPQGLRRADGLGLAPVGPLQEASAEVRRQDLERQAARLESSLEGVRARLRRLDETRGQS